MPPAAVNQNGSAHYEPHEQENFLPVDKSDVKFTESSTQNSKTTDAVHPRKETESFVPPDGGWGWLVCFASFWTNGTLFGILNNFGILYVYFLKEFSDEGDEGIAFRTAWIGSLQISTTFFLSPIASMLVDRIGIRITAFVGALIACTGMLTSSFVIRIEVLYLTYGCLLGMGSSLVYTPSMVILGHYFKRHLGIVNGIVAFGSGAFTFILPFVLKGLLEQMGLRNTLRVLAVLIAPLVPLSFVWRPLFNPRHTELDHYLTSTESVREKISGCSKWVAKFCNVSIWRNRGYIVWVIALPISFFGYFIPFVHLVKHTKDVMPDANPEILIMCIGATSGISRLICGKIADLPKVSRVRMQQVALVSLGVLTACIPFANTNFAALVAIVLAMGVCDGCMICLLGPIAFDLLGPAGAAQGLGCLLGLMSIPMTAGPPLAGLMYDHIGSYNIVFWAAGVPPILGGCLLFLMPRRSMTKHVIHVTETEAVASMSIENLDLAGIEDDTFTIDANGVAKAVLVKNGGSSIYRGNGDITNSVPNLLTNELEKRLLADKLDSVSIS